MKTHTVDNSVFFEKKIVEQREQNLNNWLFVIYN